MAWDEGKGQTENRLQDRRGLVRHGRKRPAGNERCGFGQEKLRLSSRFCKAKKYPLRAAVFKEEI